MCFFAKPNVKSNCNICNGHGSRGESTPFIKTAHKNEMYSFCRFINKWRCRAIQRFTHTFPWFPLDSLPSVNGFLRAVSISGTVVADSFVPCNYLPDDQTMPRRLYSKWNVQQGRPLQGNPSKEGVSPMPRKPSMSPSPNCPRHSQTRPAHMWNPLRFSYSFPLLCWRSCRVLFSMPRHCGTYGSNSFQTAGKSIALFSHHCSPRCWSCCVIRRQNTLKCSYTCWHT